jgi:hypothetical protein
MALLVVRFCTSRKRQAGEPAASRSSAQQRRRGGGNRAYRIGRPVLIVHLAKIMVGGEEDLVRSWTGTQKLLVQVQPLPQFNPS